MMPTVPVYPLAYLFIYLFTRTATVTIKTVLEQNGHGSINENHFIENKKETPTNQLSASCNT